MRTMASQPDHSDKDKLFKKACVTSGLHERTVQACPSREVMIGLCCSSCRTEDKCAELGNANTSHALNRGSTASLALPVLLCNQAGPIWARDCYLPMKYLKNGPSTCRQALFHGIAKFARACLAGSACMLHLQQAVAEVAGKMTEFAIASAMPKLQRMIMSMLLGCDSAVYGHLCHGPGNFGGCWLLELGFTLYRNTQICTYAGL